MCSSRCATAMVACCVFLQLASVGHSEAQPRPDDVQAAAAAFAEGQRAQLRGDHARAAQLFELADRSAPSDAALRSAIRNYQAAGSLARAATLALRARERYPDDAATVAVADEVLVAAEGSLGHLQVQCAPACSLAIDGLIASAGATERIDVFVEPGTRRLVASWPDRPTLEETASVEAGASIALELRADEVAVAAPEPQVVPDPTPEPEADPGEVRDYEVRPAPAPQDRGVHWALFTVGAGLTVVGLSLSIWSGVDTLDARDAYVLDPTRAGYEDGVGREWRTNGLLIGTAVLGIATVVVAIFTDWGGEAQSEDRASGELPAFELDVPSMAPAPGGASIALSGRFGGL